MMHARAAGLSVCLQTGGRSPASGPPPDQALCSPAASVGLLRVGPPLQPAEPPHVIANKEGLREPSKRE